MLLPSFTFVVLIQVTLSHADPQLGSIFRPAVDLLSSLTGITEAPSRYRPEDTLQTRPTYYYHDDRPQQSSFPQSSYKPQQANYQPQPSSYKPPRSSYQPQQSNYQPQQSNSQVSSGTCNNFWSYQFDRENYGLITIPNPSYTKNELRIVLSLAARLQTVRDIFILFVQAEYILISTRSDSFETMFLVCRMIMGKYL